jgi:hypothetical protein
MRETVTICPEVEDAEDAEDHEQVLDPHGENLRCVKRRKPEGEPGIEARKQS